MYMINHECCKNINILKLDNPDKLMSVHNLSKFAAIILSGL